MNDTVTIPCAKLDALEIPSISLLGGAEIKAFVDFAGGPPTNCKLSFNLLLQLAPLLASMACIFKIFNVFVKLEDFLNAAKPPFTKLPGTVPGVLGAIADLKKCIPIPGIDLFLMIKGILELVLRFLLCFIDALESILKFQATIDLNAAEGNPVLLDTLVCAQNNAKTSMDNMMGSLQPVQPIFQAVKILIDLAKLPIELPDFSSITVGVDASQAIEPLKQSVLALKQAVDSIPG